MNRRDFIESHGAKCKNWRWSWAFVNHSKKIVIFGAWDSAGQGGTRRILDEAWEVNPATGRKNPAFSEAVEYIELVSTQNYELKTFSMGHAPIDPSMPNGTSKIKSFQPILLNGSLYRHGTTWFSIETDGTYTLPDEFDISASQSFFEGARKKVLVDSVERDSNAREACLRYHGHCCKVCDFDFGAVYGEIGFGFIHVHHIDPIGQSQGIHEVDPVEDLVPVCPNCHAMLHRRKEPFSVFELNEIMRSIRCVSKK